MCKKTLATGKQSCITALVQTDYPFGYPYNEWRKAVKKKIRTIIVPQSEAKKARPGSLESPMFLRIPMV